jgi:pimeloyl-ACP methyl ester carboxylesterase
MTIARRTVATTVLACAVAAALILSGAPAAAETVKLKNGGTIYYTVAGAGQRVAVFAHGYSFSSAAWAKTLDRLPPGWRAIAYDLRGFGRSDKPETGYAYADMAGDLLQLLDALKIRRAVIVGHSMGGMMAQDFAARHPERVAGLVLVGAQARNKPPIGMTPAFEQRIAAYGTPAENRAVFEATTPRYFKPGNIPEADMKRMIEINMQSGTAALKEAFRTVLTAPAIPAETFARIKAPTLIVAPTHDIVPFAVAVGLAETIPGARIAVVENAGHTPMWEKPDRFNEHLAAFLRGVK